MSTKQPTTIDSHVGERIRIARKEAGMTQKELAGKLSMSFQQLQKYENGKNRVAAGNLFTISNLLNKRVEWFYEELDADTSRPTSDYIHAEKLLKDLYGKAGFADIVAYMEKLKETAG